MGGRGHGEGRGGDFIRWGRWSAVARGRASWPRRAVHDAYPPQLRGARLGRAWPVEVGYRSGRTADRISRSMSRDERRGAVSAA